MSHQVIDPKLARAQLRKQLISKRLALSEKMRAHHTQAIIAHLLGLLQSHNPQCVSFFWPWKGEVDLRETLALWQNAAPGRQIALPIVVEQAAPLAFALWQPTMIMTQDCYGIAMPLEKQWVRPDMMLIPVNGFDARGYRLGYGGGYFDRTLSAFTHRPFAAGIGFECARLKQLEISPFDIPMNALITEAGLFHCA